MSYVLALAGPILLILTFLIFRMNLDDPTAWSNRAIVYADLIYVALVLGYVISTTARLIRARRLGSAGSQLHLRLGGLFAVLALLPTALVAVFAGVFFNFAVEGWFSDRVQDVVGSSLTAAEAYEAEQRDDLIEDARLLGEYLNGVKLRTSFIQDDQVRDALAQGQQLVQRGLKEAFVVNGAGELLLRGENSYLFNFERPSPDQMIQAVNGEVIVIQDWNNDEFRALYQLSEFVDRYLLIARTVDGSLLNLLDDTKETAVFSRSLEENICQLLSDLGLVYLFFAIVVTFSAILLGLRIAERLARPVGHLARAAQKVGEGNYDTYVDVGADRDEFSLLANTFNKMTSQVKQQRDDLLDINEKTEEQRSLFDSVLSNLTAGVIGLTADGKIEVLNETAATLLALERPKTVGRTLLSAVPEFSEIWDKLQADPDEGALGEVKLSRGGKGEVLLVKMSGRRALDGTIYGFVVTFDDVTDLVSAQRMAAWGDVARRLAHEIKNPLTPIQLSAERLYRKFSPLAGDQTDALEQYTNVIIRQAGDLRRIVDEFSRFARMPEPEAQAESLTDIIKEVVLLQKNALPEVKLAFDPPKQAVKANVDRGLITQAFMNVIKNAGEALMNAKQSNDAKFAPEIRITLGPLRGSVVVTIEDNGPGFPKENRSRLIEPYVTNREGGSGLGLSIVKKIVEQHGGTLELSDAKSFSPGDANGAQVRMKFPKLKPSKARSKKKQLEGA